MNMKSGFDFKFGRPIIVENDKNGNNNGIFIKSVGQSPGQTKIGSESPQSESESERKSDTSIVFIKLPTNTTATLYPPIQIQQQQQNNNNVRVATAMIPPIVTNNNINSIIETGQNTNIYKNNNNRPLPLPIQVEQEVQVNLGQEKTQEFQVQDVNDNRTTSTSTRGVPEEMKMERTIPLLMDCYTQTSRFIHFPQPPFVQQEQEQVLIPKASREVADSSGKENVSTSTSVPNPNYQNLPSAKSLPVVQVVQKPPTYPILPSFDIYEYYQLLDGNQNEVHCPHVTESEDIRFGCQPAKKRRIDSEFKLKTDSNNRVAGNQSPIETGGNEVYNSRKRRLKEESRSQIQIPIQVYNHEVVNLEKSKNVQSSSDGSDDENLNELVRTPSVQRKLFKFLQKLCLGGSSAASSAQGEKDYKYEDVNRNYNNSFTRLLQKSSNFFNRRSPAQLGSSWRLGHQVIRDKRQEINILPIVNSKEMSISGLHRQEHRGDSSHKNHFDIVGIPLIRNQPSHNNNLQRSNYPSKMKVERKVDPPLPSDDKSSSYETLTSQSDYETEAEVEAEKNEILKSKKIINVEILPVPVSEKKYNPYDSVNIDISKKKKPKPKDKTKKRASSCTILHCGSGNSESVMDLELKKTMEERDQIQVRKPKVGEKVPESWEKKVNVEKSRRAGAVKPPESQTEEEISLKSPWVPFVLQSKSRKSRNEKFDVNHSQQISFTFRQYFAKLFCGCMDKKSQISPEPEPSGLSPVDIANNNTTKVKKKDETDVRERRRQWANSQRARNDDESNWVDIENSTKVRTKSEGRLHYRK